MAEAHSAVAFSFSITHEGLHINYDFEVLNLVWQSGLRSWNKRFIRFQNNLQNSLFPGSQTSLFIIVSIITAAYFIGLDLTFGGISYLEATLPGKSLPTAFRSLLACIVGGTVVMLGLIMLLRTALRLLFIYKGWMYESRGGKRVSLASKIWICLVKILERREPLLYSYQSSLPSLPLPSLEDTSERYLRTVRPLLDDEKYRRMEKLAEEFKNGIGRKLQRYLWLKSWWTSNYVSDWWEEFVYLRGRSALMVNSNFYAIDALLVQPTKIQAARAANIIHASFLFRRAIDRQELKPIMVQGLVPLCSAQYERTFNTTRIPGREIDKLLHLNDSQHIVVLNKGRFYKLPVYSKARLLRPVEIQHQLSKILNDTSSPHPGEEQLGALTSSDRASWAAARKMYFSKGPNKASLDAIEKAAFFMVLDDDEYYYDPDDPSKLNHFCQRMLHGRGYDRWYDKSFNVIISKNARVGLNVEHSWADAPILGHYWEFCLAKEVIELGYDEDGNTQGEMDVEPPAPIRLNWDIGTECCELLEGCVTVAKHLLEDVDLWVFMHNAYGKGFIKKCRVSPDAFVQMALQLAYFRDSAKFCLTYEASMTRLYREGRTETVRSVTMESCTWVRAMVDPNCPVEEKRVLLRKACNTHQRGYQDAMCGKGIDRHLFCLYVVSKYLEVDSPFLKEVLSEPWRLSTSQTPHGQANLLDLRKFPNYISAGGGFGPVADDGYGVSYIIAGEDIIFFHISSKKSSPETNSRKFARHLEQALEDMKNLFEE